MAVITGAGRAFSAGGDFDYIDELSKDAELRHLTLTHGRQIVTGMVACRLPIVAAVTSVLTGHGIKPGLVHFANVPFPDMPTALKSGAVSAAVLPEPFASGAEEAQGAEPLVDLDQGATANFPVAGYVVTKQWAARNPHTLAAFYRALEQGQQVADTSRSWVEQSMMDLQAPFGVSRETAAILALDSYPFSDGPVGSVDRVRLERVVDVMRQFIRFPKFNIDSMLMNGS